MQSFIESQTEERAMFFQSLDLAAQQEMEAEDRSHQRESIPEK